MSEVGVRLPNTYLTGFLHVVNACVSSSLCGSGKYNLCAFGAAPGSVPGRQLADPGLTRPAGLAVQFPQSPGRRPEPVHRPLHLSAADDLFCRTSHSSFWPGCPPLFSLFCAFQLQHHTDNDLNCIATADDGQLPTRP